MNWFTDTTIFVTRSNCGPGWTPELQSCSQFANLLIFISYITIAAALILFWVKERKNHPFPVIYLFFSAFIGMCGITHLDEIIVFYYPMYRLFTLISILTAFISFVTCLFFPKYIIEISKEIPRVVLDKLNAELTILNQTGIYENMKLDDRNKSLITRIHILEGMLYDNAWIHDKETALKQLRAMLDTIQPPKEESTNGS